MRSIKLNPTIEKHKKPLTVGIVSLSGGILGDPICSHQLELIKNRLSSDFNLNFKFTPHALMGSEYLSNNPKSRAEDLVTAFSDDDIDIIWSTIGGNDTYRIIPFLDNDYFTSLVHKNPKPFIGYSDTTINHLFLYNIGLNTIYGPALLTDFGELSKDMLPYTTKEIKSLLSGESSHYISQSPVWYLERDDFSASQLGTDRIQKPELKGPQFINGEGIVEGELLGGCIESICTLLPNKQHAPSCGVELSKTILPTLPEWHKKILFLETSEEQPSPESFNSMLTQISDYGIFDNVNAILFAKPIDEVYYDEYLSSLTKISTKYNLPLVANLNFGHSAPRTFLPYGQKIRIDFENKNLCLPEPIIHFI